MHHCEALFCSGLVKLWSSLTICGQYAGQDCAFRVHQVFVIHNVKQSLLLSVIYLPSSGIIQVKLFSHIRPLGAAGALAVNICICFHDIES